MFRSDEKAVTLFSSNRLNGFNPESKSDIIWLQSVQVKSAWTLFHLKIYYWSHESCFWLCTLIKSLLSFYTCVAFNLIILREFDTGQRILSMWICLYKWVNRPYIRKHQLSVTFEWKLNSLICLLSCSEKYCTNGVKRGIYYQCNKYGRLSVWWNYGWKALYSAHWSLSIKIHSLWCT